MKRVFYRCPFVAAVCGMMAMFLSFAGCGDGNLKTVSVAATKAAPATDNLPLYINAADANVEFEQPFRLKSSDGNLIEVESPGYACPTLADVDGDGDKDLIVGQFHNGNMQLYRNEAGSAATPKFGHLEWISSNGDRAEVPGVS